MSRMKPRTSRIARLSSYLRSSATDTTHFVRSRRLRFFGEPILFVCERRRGDIGDSNVDVTHCSEGGDSNAMGVDVLLETTASFFETHDNFGRSFAETTPRVRYDSASTLSFDISFLNCHSQYHPTSCPTNGSRRYVLDRDRFSNSAERVREISSSRLPFDSRLLASGK